MTDNTLCKQAVKETENYTGMKFEECFELKESEV